MLFEKCFFDIIIDADSAEIIDFCIQALSIEPSEYLDVLESLFKGESSGFEVACIYLENDYEEDDLCPEFSGVCFNYQDEYAVVSIETANKILLRSIDHLDFDSKSAERSSLLKSRDILMYQK